MHLPGASRYRNILYNLFFQDATGCCSFTHSASLVTLGKKELDQNECMQGLQIQINQQKCCQHIKTNMRTARVQKHTKMKSGISVSKTVSVGVLPGFLCSSVRCKHRINPQKTSNQSPLKTRPLFPGHRHGNLLKLCTGLRQGLKQITRVQGVFKVESTNRHCPPVREARNTPPIENYKHGCHTAGDAVLSTSGCSKRLILNVKNQTSDRDECRDLSSKPVTIRKADPRSDCNKP